MTSPARGGPDTDEEATVADMSSGPMPGSTLPCGCHIQRPDYRTMLCAAHEIEVTAAVPDPRPDCWCEPAPSEPHPWQPAEINLCDHDGIVRRGAMHHGQDYQCTGSAHWSGLHIRCTTPIHGQGPVPVIGVLPKGGFR